MSGFSNFFTTFSGGSRNISSDLSYNDIMSTAIIVPSFNTGIYHNYDGFIFVSNMLIQFSATLNPAYIPNFNTHTIYYPIKITDFPPFIVNCGTIMDVGTNNTYGCVMNDANGERFNFRNGQNQGTISWIAISIAPTKPVYTTITNAGAISNASSVAISGKIQYLYNSSSVLYKNTNYGYGTWTQTGNLSTLGVTNFASIAVNSSTGKYVGISSQNTRNVYISSDYGVTFSQRDFNLGSYGMSFCISSNGRYMAFMQGSIAGISGGNNIYQYSFGYFNDYGLYSQYLNDFQSTSSGVCYSIAASDDLSYYYVSGTGCILISRYGLYTFVKYTLPTTSIFYSVTTNNTGKYCCTCAYGEGIYTSSNYGSSFTKSNAPHKTWKSITSDITGQYLSCCTESSSDGIYYSTDYGYTWNLTNAPNKSYISISMNREGNIATAITSTEVHVSFNASN